MLATGFFLSAQAQQPTNPNQPEQSGYDQHQHDRTQGVIQDRDVPSNVMTAFNSAYPGINNAKWKKDGSNYKVMYETADNMDMMVIYDASANLVKTKEEIKSAQLPSAVTEYVSSNYDKNDIKQAYKITEANGTMTYKTEVRGMYLVFDSQGKFMKSEKKDADRSSSRR